MCANTNLKTWLAMAAFLPALGAATARAEVIYVDAGAGGANNGTVGLIPILCRRPETITSQEMMLMKKTLSTIERSEFMSRD